MNTLVTGVTQVGKSTVVALEDAIPTIRSNSCAVFILDPHGTFQKRVSEWCAVMGHGSRWIGDDLGSTELVASPGILSRSKAEGMQKKFDHRRTAKDFAYALAMNRPDFDQRPNNRKYTILPIQGWLDTDLPLGYLPWALRPGTEPFKQILSQIKDQEILYELRLIESLPVTRRFETVGGADRILTEAFGEEPFKYRMDPTFDLDSFIEHKGIYCLSGGNADDATITLMMRLLNLQLIQKVKSHYARTNQPLPIKVYIDEAANYKLIGLPESRAMAQTTKMGLTWTIITQVPNFGEEEIDFNVMQNTPRKLWLKCFPPVSKTAADNMKALLDPMKIHHTDRTTKQIRTGEEIVNRVARRVDADGLGAGRVINQAAVPIYENIVEEKHTYMHLTDQGLMTEVEVEQQGKGQCKITDGVTVFTHTFPDWSDPGVFPGYSQAKLDQRIEELKNFGVLKPPVDWAPTWAPATPSPAGKKARTPAKKPPMGLGD